MKLSREKIQRMIEGNRGGSSGSGGGSSIAGGASQAWVNQNYVSIEFFRKVFKVWAAGATSSDPDVEIVPNDIASTVKNIQAQAGLWTESFLSALGNGGGGGTGGASTLDQLDDVVITSPTNGQALIYNATTQMWVNGTIQSGTDMATVWAALAAATNEPINASHLSGVLADYVTTTSLQTILGDYLTQTAADQRYITIAYFDRLFRAYNGSTLVSHNDTTTTIDNIKAMFGFWTDLYFSALGRNSVATGLGIDNLTDVTINTPTSGQVLQYNATSAKWENATLNIQTVTALANLTDVLLTNPSDGQTLLYDGTNARWYNSALKTINGQSLLGSGDISVGGGASGNYLPLSGGTLVGQLKIQYTAGDWQRYLAIYNSSLGTNNHMVFAIGIQDARQQQGQVAFYKGSNNNNNYLGLGFHSYDDKLRVYGNGNIGIGGAAGSAAPNYMLQVYGTAFFTNICLDNLGRNTSPTAFPTWVNNDSKQGFRYSEAGDMPFVNRNGGGFYGSDTITFDNNGNMKLNTSNYSYWHIDTNSGGIVLSVTATGNVGIGTTGPSYKLDVYGDIRATGAITALSDMRDKIVMDEARIGIEKIAQAPSFVYNWKDPQKHDYDLHVGSSAQYWKAVLPEVVLEAKDKKGTLSMQYGVAALVSAITIARKVVDHEQRIKKIEQQIKKIA